MTNSRRLVLGLALAGCASGSDHPAADALPSDAWVDAVLADASIPDARPPALDAPWTNDGGPPDCCLHLEGVMEGAIDLCGCSGYSGLPVGDQPAVAYYAAQGGVTAKVTLCGSFTRDSTSSSTIGFMVAGASSPPPGSYTNPYIEYRAFSGATYVNDSGAGAIVVDTWPDVGSRAVGRLRVDVKKQSGVGPDSLTLQGSFCAVRAN